MNQEEGLTLLLIEDIASLLHPVRINGITRCVDYVIMMRCECKEKPSNMCRCCGCKGQCRLNLTYNMLRILRPNHHYELHKHGGETLESAISRYIFGL